MGSTREPLRVLEQASVLDLGRFPWLDLNNNSSKWYLLRMDYVPGAVCSTY